MLIRLKDERSNDLNVNANHIISAEPHEDGEGTLLTLSNGLSRKVLSSTQSIRGYVKKALANTNSGTED